jgi:hypothetical protein
MNYELECTLHKIYDTESKSGTFQTREFVVTTEGQYPNFIKFQSVQDRCNIIDGFNEGDKIKVSFDLRGREWQGKYFTNLNAWRVERLSNDNRSNNSAPKHPSDSFSSLKATDEPMINDFNGTEDDLPF